ncbi:DUF72 domain-containing protein [Nocardioides sp.]|uniref:DUF72 domain-containing protein n=1 Tax=Nocardioides sp. TaxID=35761 RepID=UPI0031FE5BE9|nr:hypothetical protein [Nocardioides sp.]
MAEVRIGCSGWSYVHWVGVLYPPGLPKAKWRDAYAAHFDTVELNASFYRWPGEKPFVMWRNALPPGFLMSVKASRWITHARRLKDDEGAWAERLTKAWEALGDRRGVMLLQLHPAHERDDARLDEFLSRLPRTMRVAVEFRHPSWHHEAVYELLERRGAAYVVMSGAGLPCVLRATAEFVYVRMHGPSHEHLYAGSYSDSDLDWWADRIREWQVQERDVFVYFNNDGQGHAVVDADRLRTRLGQTLPD